MRGVHLGAWMVMVAGCAAAPCPEPVVVAAQPAPTEADASAIAAALDDWHQAASVGDGDRYFGHFTEDGVFLGTDAAERWTVDEFRAYATDAFADGHGWTMHPPRRAIVVKGEYAFFDEDLDSEGLGPVRGSGVMLRTASGWAIAHYVLSFTIPNERVADLKAMLDRAATTPGGDEAEESAADEPTAPDADADE